MKRPAKRSVLWICALVLPLAVVLGVPAAIAWWSGEIYHLEDVARRQTGGAETLFGSAYSSPDVPLKLGRARRDRPDVLVLGSSRTLDIRRAFIKPEFSFYNAGRIASDIWVIRQALMKLDHLPSHVIIGLDQFRFNSQGTDYKESLINNRTIEEKFAPEDEGWGRFSVIWPKINADFYKGKINPLAAGGGGSRIGLAARMLGNGFRNDGSYRYGSLIDLPPAERKTAEIMADDLRRAAKSKRSFEHGDSLSTEAVDEVGRLLDWCVERKIKVTTYLPAYAPSLSEAMRRPPSDFTYMDKIVPALRPVFEKRGLRLFDFTHPEGAVDAEFIDGFHSSERITARNLLVMAAADPAAAEIIAVEEIKSLLTASTDPLVLIR